ncbi:hypothetical protein HB837_14615 [Listeria innocua]|uniref:hypothetical protein n=1 Tax=Listeria innocua TaxID=1642 RepID=UPI00162A1CAB|nr:hypothetical protein [Listeria innocua]MBC1339429.1 hypothetical protein [Listeria innocua]MBC1353669.1 hypothetical protein [Listeria innocua]
MNAKRRKAITKSLGIIQEQLDSLDIFIEEEQEYIDNFPENLEGSYRYEKAEEALADLEFARDALLDSFSYLESATE